MASKTWVAPPLAIKAQDDKQETARGFLLVQIQRTQAANASTVSISARPFWYENVRPATSWWTYAVRSLVVLVIILVLFALAYLYLIIRRRNPALLERTYPTLVTLIGFAVIAVVVWETMHFMIADLGLESMYWITPILGAVGGIFGALGDGNVFTLAWYEEKTRIKAGILGDIVSGIGGAIAVVFVSERTLRLQAGDSDSLLWLASISFVAGVAGRKVVQVALQRVFKQLAQVKRDFDEQISSMRQELSDAKKIAEKALDSTNKPPISTK